MTINAIWKRRVEAQSQTELTHLRIMSYIVSKFGLSHIVNHTGYDLCVLFAHVEAVEMETLIDIINFDETSVGRFNCRGCAAAWTTLVKRRSTQ